MRAIRDQFAKRLARQQLANWGRVGTEEEVSVDPQRIDVWFVPAAGAASHCCELLRQMTAQPGMFEIFFEPPQVEDVRACLRKQLVWDHAYAKQTASQSSSPVRLWMISSGRPVGAIEGFCFGRDAGGLEGIYEAPRALNVGLVVLRELPRTRETLMLRLLGSRRVLKEAIEDLLALPLDAPERSIQETLAEFYREAREIMAIRPLTPEEDDLMEGTRESFQDFLRRVREEAARGTSEEGARRTAAGLKLAYARRFGECPRAVADALDAADGEHLYGWIPLFAAGSAEEIAAELHGT